MYQAHIHSLEESLKIATQRQPVTELASRLFNIFFEGHPEAADYFKDYDLEVLGPKKFRILAESIIDTLKYPDFAEGRLNEEVYRHMTHNLQDQEYYFAMIDALIACVKITLGDDWTAAYEEHWQESAAGMKHMIGLAAKDYLKAG